MCGVDLLSGRLSFCCRSGACLNWISSFSYLWELAGLRRDRVSIVDVFDRRPERVIRGEVGRSSSSLSDRDVCRNRVWPFGISALSLMSGVSLLFESSQNMSDIVVLLSSSSEGTYISGDMRLLPSSSHSIGCDNANMSCENATCVENQLSSASSSIPISVWDIGSSASTICFSWSCKRCQRSIFRANAGWSISGRIFDARRLI